VILNISSGIYDWQWMPGADFIKTSTGKPLFLLRPEAAFVMCRAIQIFQNRDIRSALSSGRIVTPSDANSYYRIVNIAWGGVA